MEPSYENQMVPIEVTTDPETAQVLNTMANRIVDLQESLTLTQRNHASTAQLTNTHDTQMGFLNRMSMSLIETRVPRIEDR